MAMFFSPGPVRRKTVKFNPGLSQTLSKNFLYKNVQLKLTKYCLAFFFRDTVTG